MLKKVFYLVLIAGAIYHYFGVEFIIDKAPFLAPYILTKKEDKVMVVNSDMSSNPVSISGKQDENKIERKAVEIDSRDGHMVVETIDGDSMILRDGQVIIPQSKTEIKEGDILKTSDRSYLVLLFGQNSRMKILARSKIKLVSTIKQIKIDMSEGQVFGDFSKIENSDFLEIKSQQGNYHFDDAMFYLEVNPQAEKVVMLSGNVQVEAPRKKMSYQVKKKEGSIIDEAGKMIQPEEYPWIKDFPWKNIAFGVINFSKVKDQSARETLSDSQTEEDAHAMLIKLKEEALKGMLNSKAGLKDAVLKTSGMDEVQKQMKEHYQKADKYMEESE